jgi:plasmid stabilization system protein ParE
MKRRYVLAPQAALDLVQIWRYIKKESSVKIADRVEEAVRDQIVSLAKDQAWVTGARISRKKQ